MAEGNGIDLGSIVEMLRSLVVGQEQLRNEMRAEFAKLRAEMNLEFAKVRAEMNLDFAKVRAEIKDVREHLNLVHVAVIGHGIAITELQEDVREMRADTGLPPRAA